MARILIVEDDELLGDGITTGLKQYGYTVDWVKDGLMAQHAISSEHFDGIILDIGLPKRTGLEILQTIRKDKVNTPVIILTARDSINDKVKGLDYGADDYLVKPFDLDELSARLRSIIRRSGGTGSPVIKIGNVEIDSAAHKVTVNGTLTILSRREFSLLHKLVEQPGRVITRDVLSQSIYGWGDDVDSNAIEVHIHNIRKKLGDNLNIRTIRGVGYIIENTE